MKFSVFTVILNEYPDPLDAAKLLADCGYDGVEWRVSPDFHVSPEDILDETENLKKIAKEYKLETSALATYLPSTDIKAITPVFEAAHQLGAGVARVAVPSYDGKTPYSKLFSQTVDSLGRVEEVARKTGVKAVVEIHMNTMIPSAALAKQLVQRFDPRYIGVIFDPGNMIIEGRENWALSLDLLGEYLAHVHVKNTGWFQNPDGTWQWKWMSCPNGIVNWSEVMKDLKAVGYNGWMSLEDFSDIPVEVKIADDLAFLRDLDKA